MRKLIFAAVAVFAIGLVACNKDQKAVKTLEGDWEEVSVDGTAVPDSLKGTLHFDFCKLNKDEWCTANYTDSDGTSSGNYEYKVSEKGTVLTQRVTEEGKGTIEIPGTIKELTETSLELETNLLGTVTNTVYSKK